MIISFANQKGGVGKTTLSVNLAFEAAFRNLDMRVLLIDADPQASILEWSDNRQGKLPSNLSIMGMAKKTLNRDIKNVADDYQLVIIDAPPRSTDITRSAILASDVVIVPCTPSEYDLYASANTIEMIREARLYKEELISLFAISRKIVNTTIGKELRDKIKALGDDMVLLDIEICQRVAWAKSSEGLSVHELTNANECKVEISKMFDEICKVIGVFAK